MLPSSLHTLEEMLQTTNNIKNKLQLRDHSAGNENFIFTVYTGVCIVQNSGRVKLWQIDHFRVLARKTLVNFNISN